jgi:hypothetical protein
MSPRYHRRIPRGTYYPVALVGKQGISRGHKQLRQLAACAGSRQRRDGGTAQGAHHAGRRDAPSTPSPACTSSSSARRCWTATWKAPVAGGAPRRRGRSSPCRRDAPGGTANTRAFGARGSFLSVVGPTPRPTVCAAAWKPAAWRPITCSSEQGAALCPSRRGRAPHSVGLVAALAGNPYLAVAAGVVWLFLTLRFLNRRLRGTSHAPVHVAEMVVTSLVIPFLSIFWCLYGAVKFCVFFF